MTDNTSTTTTSAHQEPTIEDELRILLHEVPEMADRLRTAITQGTIYGLDYESCVYGCICQGEIGEAIQLAERVAAQLHVGSTRTPIQILVEEVKRRETHQTNDALKTLYDALQVYTKPHA